MDKFTMKRAYKEAKRSMGVYRIITPRNDKVYIGIDTDLPAKLNRHKAELKFGSSRNRELQQAWNMLGELAFDFEVLDTLDHQEAPKTNPAEELQVLLEMWIRKLEKEGYSIVTL